MEPIYLDYNASTPVDPEVARAMEPYLATHFGNPSSSHAYGAATREAVAVARERLAAAIGADPAEIVFTSGGTESNNHAIRGTVAAAGEGPHHVVTSAVEHPAVSMVCDHLESRGVAVTRVPVDGAGRVDPADVARAIRPETALVSIMHANNEVGTLMPIAEIAAAARERGVPVHTDAAQSVGKVPVRVDDLGVDLLSLAGHKLYAPKGVGALYVRRGTRLGNLMFGAGHEGGRRPGTENVLEIVGLGRAVEIAVERLAADAIHAGELRDRLEEGLGERIPGLTSNGDPEQRLPNTTSLCLPGIVAVELLAAVPEVAASPGAACHSGAVSLSDTLRAMGVSEERAAGTIRFSTGRFLTPAEVDRAVGMLAAAWIRAREGQR